MGFILLKMRTNGVRKTPFCARAATKKPASLWEAGWIKV
jgi:hypothetical protein